MGVMVAIISLQSSLGLEITTCECNKSIFIGIINSADPDLCSEVDHAEVSYLDYEVIERKEAPLANIGYLCRQ